MFMKRLLRRLRAPSSASAALGGLRTSELRPGYIGSAVLWPGPVQSNDMQLVVLPAAAEILRGRPAVHLRVLWLSQTRVLSERRT